MLFITLKWATDFQLNGEKSERYLTTNPLLRILTFNPRYAKQQNEKDTCNDSIIDKQFVN